MAVIDPSNQGLQLVARYAVLTLVAVIFAFPLVFMLVSSLKPDDQLLRDTASLRAFLPVGDLSLAELRRRLRAGAGRHLHPELGHRDRA